MFNKDEFRATATAVESIKHFCYREREQANTRNPNPTGQLITIEQSYLIAKISEALGSIVSGDFTDTRMWRDLLRWSELGLDYSTSANVKTDALSETPLSPTQGNS